MAWGQSRVGALLSCGRQFTLFKYSIVRRSSPHPGLAVVAVYPFVLFPLASHPIPRSIASTLLVSTPLTLIPVVPGGCTISPVASVASPDQRLSKPYFHLPLRSRVLRTPVASPNVNLRSGFALIVPGLSTETHLGLVFLISGASTTTSSTTDVLGLPPPVAVVPPPHVTRHHASIAVCLFAASILHPGPKTPR
ncbi:hypothetical protein EX30DRAFT_348433 [Ascodesmis nigricans]|uniref:Uncharacterized protein n=1 Tax=Ascodesmis nigricans TaxID=341454 RepID=A0A4S2MYC3_9PEZI|nr:hypothetical protein EX30DRAFT_348433 [Ascodesmis nigricans]